ncbi:hypothetical protein OOK41_08910 [Micromonospora sp. NBC_01655]|uniref:hypothetical protein n=1 Tax=Micromonospora sp. NBC_01655 TaxID=2975983 RepID=UPI0022588CB6|nr:hypothetical protein [Micromonospora sp. NBC_01655]MCX4470424.1 hypothetical protein [Micromonospora sp. NBC_01655]
MDEREHTGPLPHAHPVAHGRPPVADGQTIPQPPAPAAPPLTRRQYLAGWLCAAVVLVLLVAGVLGLR